MSWEDFPITDGFYQSESLPVNAQRCKNFYPNIPETNSISTGQLYPTPGLVSLVDTGPTNVNRGAITLNSIPYFINGTQLYRLDRTVDAFGNDVFSFTDVSGTETITGATRVSVAENGTQICIVEPGTGNGWIYTEAGGLVKITDPDFTGTFPDGSAKLAEIVVYIDGYFVFTTNSKNFFISELNDGLSYNALDFGTAEADPDAIRSAHVHRNQLYIMGSETIEVFDNIGGADFPFRRIKGFVIPKGIAAPFSVIEYDGSFAWIGQGVNETPRIYVFSGNDAAPISTTPIDNLLQGYSDSDIEQAFVWSYSFRGATFVGWNLRNNTIAHESKASRLSNRQIWHERESSELQNKSRWRINSLVSAYGRLIVGDSEGGTIGEINNDTYTDYGNTIFRELVTAPISNQSRTMFFGGCEIEIESGLAELDENPQVGMQYSDNARVYSSTRFRSAGMRGEYGEKLRWERLPRTSRLRLFRFTFTDPNRWIIWRFNVEIDA